MAVVERAAERLKVYICMYDEKYIYVCSYNTREEKGVRAARNGRGETSSGKVTHRRGKNKKIN
jgi:hypothetical protein